jgi:hypothetical protein
MLSYENTALQAVPPPGQPYFRARKAYQSTDPDINLSLDITLQRGILLRGKVTEEGSGEPVVGAEVVFQTGTYLTNTSRERSATVTGPDGTYQFAVLPKPGFLMVVGGSHEYIPRHILSKTDEPRPQGPRYAHAWKFLELNSQSGDQEVALQLRRGETLEFQVRDPQDQPVDSASVISANIRFSDTFPRLWSPSLHGTVHRGRFTLFGVDHDAETGVFFLEPQRKLGATVYLSGKTGRDGPVAVCLEPCGAAHARLVGPDQKPVTKLRNAYDAFITLVATRGWPVLRRAPQHGERSRAEEGSLPNGDPTNYARPPYPDAEGRIRLPVLIPGATYRFYDSSPSRENRDALPVLRKEFGVRAGETLDLGDILIENPPK